MSPVSWQRPVQTLLNCGVSALPTLLQTSKHMHLVWRKWAALSLSFVGDFHVRIVWSSWKLVEDSLWLRHYSVVTCVMMLMWPNQSWVLGMAWRGGHGQARAGARWLQTSEWDPECSDGLAPRKAGIIWTSQTKPSWTFWQKNILNKILLTWN